ncbi:MAG: hypothetical protein AAB914_00940, partial [Patescibacteria group bacterium]
MAKVEPETTAEESAARAVEPAAQRKLRVLMLTDITTDMRETDQEVGSVESQAEAAGFDVPVLLNVDDVGVDGVLEALRVARESGEPFDILVEDIWSREGLLEFAKAEQPGLYTVVVAFAGAEYTASHLWTNPAVNNVVLKRNSKHDLASQAEVAFALAASQLRNPQVVPLPHTQIP